MKNVKTKKAQGAQAFQKSLSKKAQGALEYLLLIGGAVLIAAIVLTLLSNLGQQSSATTTTRVAATQCESLPQDKCTSVAWSDFTGPSGTKDGTSDCTWNAALTPPKCEVILGVPDEALPIE